MAIEDKSFHCLTTEQVTNISKQGVMSIVCSVMEYSGRPELQSYCGYCGAIT